MKAGYKKGRRLLRSDMDRLGEKSFVFLCGVLLPVSGVNWSSVDFSSDEVYEALEV